MNKLNTLSLVVAVLVVAAVGCSSTTEPATQLEPTSSVSSTPTATPTVTPTPDPTPDRCASALEDLATAEADTIAAAEAIDRFLNDPELRRLTTDFQYEFDGSHIADEQAIWRELDLTQHLLTDDEIEIVDKWGAAWVAAESFGNNAELWNTATEAAAEAAGIDFGRFAADKELTGVTHVATAAAAVAKWRTDWLHAINAATDERTFIQAEAAVASAKIAYLFMYTLVTGEIGDELAADQFASPLRDTFMELSIATTRINIYC